MKLLSTACLVAVALGTPDHMPHSIQTDKKPVNKKEQTKAQDEIKKIEPIILHSKMSKEQEAQLAEDVSEVEKMRKALAKAEHQASEVKADAKVEAVVKETAKAEKKIDTKTEAVSKVSKTQESSKTKKNEVATKKIEPKVAEAKVTKAKVTEAKVTEAKVTEAKVTEAKVTEAKVTEPKVAEPKVAEPKVAEPKVAEPKVAEAKVAEAKVATAKVDTAKEAKAPKAKVVEAKMAEAKPTVAKVAAKAVETKVEQKKASAKPAVQEQSASSVKPVHHSVAKPEAAAKMKERLVKAEAKGEQMAIDKMSSTSHEHTTMKTTNLRRTPVMRPRNFAKTVEQWEAANPVGSKGMLHAGRVHLGRPHIAALPVVKALPWTSTPGPEVTNATKPDAVNFGAEKKASGDASSPEIIAKFTESAQASNERAQKHLEEAKKAFAKTSANADNIHETGKKIEKTAGNIKYLYSTPEPPAPPTTQAPAPEAKSAANSPRSFLIAASLLALGATMWAC